MVAYEMGVDRAKEMARLLGKSQHHSTVEVAVLALELELYRVELELESKKEHITDLEDKIKGLNTIGGINYSTAMDRVKELAAIGRKMYDILKPEGSFHNGHNKPESCYGCKLSVEWESLQPADKGD